MIRHIFKALNLGGGESGLIPRYFRSIFVFGVLLSWLIAFCNARTSGKIEGQVIDVYAVTQGKAILPCNILPPSFNEDYTILVLWYKNAGDMPIYSYDARMSPGSHAKNEAALGQRAYFRTLTEPATLSIDKVRESDGGLYRCRVDFLKSPTRNSLVRLNIIVPPQQPKIFDEMGTELKLYAGPYKEKSSMTLTCIASGGRPASKVTWWKEGNLLDTSYKVISQDGAVQNKITVKNLSRMDLHSKLKCQATNNNMSQPVFSEVRIDMTFPPTDVKILGSNQPISAKQEIKLTCQSYGSRPPAEISWFIEGQKLPSSTVEISPDGNMSTSTLKMKGRSDDDGKTLTCRAENTKLVGSAVEDSWNLQIFYVPILSLALGANLDEENIKEGSDVYFECKINANPKVYKILWHHNGVLVQQNASGGIIISNQSLVLQKVRIASQGIYECSATNIEGENFSNPVQLSVMHKPTCQSKKTVIYGVGKGEEAHISCSVDAHPSADSFRWTFNHSKAETMKIPQSRYLLKGRGSNSGETLKYVPTTNLDYGTLLCWAENIVGEQEEPCTFHVIPAGAPDPPMNCTAQNITSDSFEVNCLEGFDGGSPQRFYAEVIDGMNPILIANQSAPIPFFVISKLDAGQAVRVYIYAANRNGISQRKRLLLRTMAATGKRTELSLTAFVSGEQFEVTPLFGVVVGILGGVLILSFAIIIICRLRNSEGKYAGSSPNSRTHCSTKKLEIPKGNAGRGGEDRDSSVSQEDKNPDLIPSSKDMSLFHESDGTSASRPNDCDITDKLRKHTYFRDSNPCSDVTYSDLFLNSRFPTSSSPDFPPRSLQYECHTMDRKRRRSPYGSSTDPSMRTSAAQVIYATVDHRATANDARGISTSLGFNHSQSLHSNNNFGHNPEIVSVRSPLLMISQQESCV